MQHRSICRAALVALVALFAGGTVTVVAPVAAHAVGPVGAAYSWGENSSRQLGDGLPVGTKVVNPAAAAGLTNVSDLVAFGGGTFARDGGTGTWNAWGYGANGEVCDGAFATRFTPVATGIPGTATIAGGGYHDVYLDGDAVSACGDNGVGELGNGTTTNSSVPVAVQGLSAGVVGVAAGSYHSLAVMADGTVRTWGYNYGGQLGDGTTTNRTTPVAVPGVTTAVAVAGGYMDSLALLADGTVVGWGLNAHGELGDGTTTQRLTPVPVAGLTNIVEIATSNYWSMARRADGTIWVWGGNFTGQLGDGTTTDAHVPQQVAGLANVVRIAAGGNHAVVLQVDGSVATWGDNYYRQLGNSTSASIGTSPGVVSGVTATAVVAGRNHTARAPRRRDGRFMGRQRLGRDRQRRDARECAAHEPGGGGAPGRHRTHGHRRRVLPRLGAHRFGWRTRVG